MTGLAKFSSIILNFIAIILMVVVLESRVEKNKRIKREKKLAFFKFLIILSTFLILFYGIKLVNDEIVYLGYIENPIIFNLNIKEKTLALFGERYLIDLRILKKIP